MVRMIHSISSITPLLAHPSELVTFNFKLKLKSTEVMPGPKSIYRIVLTNLSL